jgi:thioredoxin-related protein
MKSFLLICLIIVTSGSEKWETDFEQAKVEAKQNGKLILLNFSGSDWCAPCIKLDRDVFKQESFGEFASKNLVLVRADFPRQKKHQLEAKQREHNEKLAEQYNPQGKFPLTLLLNAEGMIIHSWDGYSGQPVKDFVQVIDAHAHPRE